MITKIQASPFLTDIRRLYSSSRCLLDAMKSPPFWIQPVWSPVSSSRSLLITFLVWAKSSTSTSLGRSCHSRPSQHRRISRWTKISTVRRNVCTYIQVNIPRHTSASSLHSCQHSYSWLPAVCQVVPAVSLSRSSRTALVKPILARW